MFNLTGRSKKTQSKQVLQLVKQQACEICAYDSYLFPHVFVVLPCYNEEENLSPVISDISSSLASHFSFDVIAVDDGSSDRTKLVLESLSSKYPVKIISHMQNMGLSYTLGDGLMYALSLARPTDIIVTMDADNTHETRYLEQMIASVSKGSDFVIASRYIMGGLQLGVSNNRIVLSKAVNHLIKTLSGITVRDATSGFRCYKASLLKEAQEKFGFHLINSRGFEIQVELLVKLGALSNGIKEIPFVLRYDKKKGKSKMPMLKTIRDYIILCLKIITWRM